MLVEKSCWLVLMTGASARHVDGARYWTNLRAATSSLVSRPISTTTFSWVNGLNPDRVYGNGIYSGLQVRNLEASGIVSGGTVFLVGFDVFDCNRSAWHNLFGWVGHHAADSAGGRRLRKGYGAKREHQQAYKRKLYEFRILGNSLGNEFT